MFREPGFFPDRFFRSLPLAAALLVAALSGCNVWNDGLARYEDGSRSINGTDVFFDMCKTGKHKVHRTRFVSPRFERMDTVVWICPEEMATPSAGAVDWFEKWLHEKPGRTLIFVPRTWEADVDYWTKAVPRTNSRDRWRAEAKLSEAQSARDRWLVKPVSAGAASFASPPSSPSASSSGTTSSGTASESTSAWLKLSKRSDRFEADGAEGMPGWTENLDLLSEPLEILVSMEPQDGDWNELLVGTHLAKPGEKETLAAVKRFGQSRLIIVQSPVFLLNESLVDHQRRKLAGRLIAEFGPPRKNIVFLRMGPSLRFIESDAADAPQNTPLILLQMWPIAVVCWHLILLGIAYTFWRWPIFGRARTLETTNTADFERHIDAYADLLAQTQDRTYAYGHIERYLLQAEGEMR